MPLLGDEKVNIRDGIVRSTNYKPVEKEPDESPKGPFSSQADKRTSKMGSLYGDSEVELEYWDRKAGFFEAIQFVIKGTYLSAFLPLYPFCFLKIIPHDIKLVISLLALMPFIKFSSDFTEFAADRVSQVAGGFLNASLGNLPELIICSLSIKKGMNQIAKVSMFGSIIGNLLLVTGCVYIVQGFFHRSCEFSRSIGGAYATCILVSALTFAFFDLYHNYIKTSSQTTENYLSVGIAALLLGLYAVFSRHMLTTGADTEMSELISPPSELPTVSLMTCAFWLGFMSLAMGFLCDVIIDCIQPVAETWHCTQVFIAAIIIPFVGNISEHFTAVIAASKNKMNLALSIAAGSAIQIGTLLYPVLVLVAFFANEPLSFYVGEMETPIILATCVFSSYPLMSGSSSYVIGYGFMCFYIFYVVVYYFREESQAIASS